MKTDAAPAAHRALSAIIPVGMSLAALLLVLIQAAIAGPDRHADEGTMAHLFQLLVAGQVPIVGFFAAKWMPRDPSRSLQVMGTQALAAALALAPVVILGW